MVGQLGLEATPAEYVRSMVEVFREVKRVLADDGTLWLNLGDSYTGSGKGGNPDPASSKQATNAGSQTIGTLYGKTGESAREAAVTNVSRRLCAEQGMAPKNLVGIPWRVAFALQQPYYAGTIKDERQRVWLAAMLEAEGCIYIHRRKEGQENGQGYQRQADSFGVGLDLANTSERLVERCREIAGCGSITRQDKARRQPLFRWIVRTQDARRVLRELYPYFVGKQQQARIGFGCPSSGDGALASWAALKALHAGEPSDVDFPPPPSLLEPGWYLRSDVIWSKPNPMPESVTDRPTKAHEYVFLLSKSERYFYDADAIAELVAASTVERMAQDIEQQEGSDRVPGKTNGKMKAVGPRFGGTKYGDSTEGDGRRNARTVWAIATQSFKDAHFATFPPELPRRCISAGSPRGLCPSCGAPLRGARLDHAKEQARCDLRGLPEPAIEGTAPVLRPEVSCAMVGEGEIEHEGRLCDDQRLLGRVRSGAPASVEGRICDGASAGDGAGHRSSVASDRGSASQKRESAREQFGELGTSPEERARQDAEETDGTYDRAVSPLRATALPEWTCDACGREGQWGDATPSVILDPFGGAGTTGLVADRLNRSAILIELNPKYAQMAERRITNDNPLFTEVSNG